MKNKSKLTLSNLLNKLSGKKPVEKQIKSKTGRVYFRLEEEHISKKFDITDISIEHGVKKMALVLSDTGSRIVSYRKDGQKVNALIDLKDLKTKETFKDCDINLKIYDDVIIVEGTPSDEKQLSAFSNLLSLKEIKAKREEQKIIIERKQLEQFAMRTKVAGGQISISDFFSSATVDTILNSTTAHYGNSINTNVLQRGVEDGITVASLFSGMGGLDISFKQTGFNLVFALDKSFHKDNAKNRSLYGESECSAVGSDHIETYRHNIGNHIVDADFLTYPIEDFPAADVYIVTIPCVELSSVSRDRNNFKLLPKFVSKFIDVMKHLKNKCKVFVLENSDNLLSAGKDFVEQIKSELPWFTISEHVVDAADFGAPQHRKRAIVIGSTIGKIELVTPTLKVVNTVGKAFEGLSNNIPNQDPSKYCTVSRQETVERMKYIPQGGNWENVPEHLRTKSKFSNFLRRLHLDKVAVSIVNIRKSLIIHPLFNRGLSIRECLRLFGFDDTFVCKGDLAGMQQMVCNSVPVALGKAIAKTVKKAFSNVPSFC